MASLRKIYFLILIIFFCSHAKAVINPDSLIVIRENGFESYLIDTIGNASTGVYKNEIKLSIFDRGDRNAFLIGMLGQPME